MIIPNTVTNKHQIPSFNGSLRLNSEDGFKLAKQMGRKFRKVLHKANNELLMEWDSGVLLITPKGNPRKDKIVSVCMSTNPKQSTEISWAKKSVDEIKEELVNAFRKYSSTNKPKNHKPLPGDVLALTSQKETFITRKIKSYTDFMVPHVSFVHKENRVLNANSHHNISTFDYTRVKREVETLFICKLSEDSRKKVYENSKELTDFVQKALLKKFSTSNVIWFPFRKLLGFSENTKKYTCSSLVGDALKKTGILPKETNVSQLTPRDIVELGIYTNIFERIIRVK